MSSGIVAGHRADDADQAGQPPAAKKRISASTGGRIKSRLKEAGLTAIGDRIEIVETNDGLRIELAEGPNGQEFFAIASASMTPTMKKTLEIVGAGAGSAAQSDDHRRTHRRGSVRRAYTATGSCPPIARTRRVACSRPRASNPARIVEVRGMADRELRNAANPLDPRNRRITILLPFTTHAGG